MPCRCTAYRANSGVTSPSRQQFVVSAWGLYLSERSTGLWSNAGDRTPRRLEHGCDPTDSLTAEVCECGGDRWDSGRKRVTHWQGIVHMGGRIPAASSGCDRWRGRRRRFSSSGVWVERCRERSRTRQPSGSRRGRPRRPPAPDAQGVPETDRSSERVG